MPLRTEPAPPRSGNPSLLPVVLLLPSLLVGGGIVALWGIYGLLYFTRTSKAKGRGICRS